MKTILVWRTSTEKTPSGWVQYAKTEEEAAELFEKQFPDAYYYPLHSQGSGRALHCWRNRDESFDREAWIACIVTVRSATPK